MERSRETGKIGAEIEGDLRDTKAVEQVLDGSLRGHSTDRACLRSVHPEEPREINGTATVQLAHAELERGAFRFVFDSTSRPRLPTLPRSWLQRLLLVKSIRKELWAFSGSSIRIGVWQRR